MEKYLIGLADDHSLIRKGLVELINTFDNYEVMFHVGNGQDLIDEVTNGRVPDIAMLDVNMPRKDGFETAAWLKSAHPDIRILALSMYDEEATIIRMLKCGAKGYVFKDAEPRELKQALDSIVNKGYHYSELITGHLIHNINEEQGRRPGEEQEPGSMTGSSNFSGTSAPRWGIRRLARRCTLAQGPWRATGMPFANASAFDPGSASPCMPSKTGL